tara:strand:- start:10074 stop:10667 length:594 start_codon:yes stop_codon:yes gene_type:complete
MTFDELFKYYADIGFSSYQQPQGIETIQTEMVSPIADVTQAQPIVAPILPVDYGQGDDRDDSGINYFNRDELLGSADYFPQFPFEQRLKTGLASLYDVYSGLPTPMNLIKQGFERMEQNRLAKLEAERIAAEKAEAERIAKEKIKKAEEAAYQQKLAKSKTVIQDRDGGGGWQEQTRAKEKAGEKVAGPGFGRGAYF